MPSFSVLPGSEGFLFSSSFSSSFSPVRRFSRRERGRGRGRFIPRWSLNHKSVPRNFCGTQLKDQPMKKILFVSLALAGLFVLFTVALRATSSPKIFPPIPCKTAGRFSAIPICSSGIQRIKTSPSPGIPSQTNSYFFHPLGDYVTRNDDFSIAFDLRLNDIASGVEPGKTGPMELGFGLLNFTAAATCTNFMRGGFWQRPERRRVRLLHRWLLHFRRLHYSFASHDYAVIHFRGQQL